MRPRQGGRVSGGVEAPVRPVTPSQWLALRRRLARAARSARAYPDGSISRCPRCRRKTFRGRNDLDIEVPRGERVYVFMGLKGARCDECGSQALESESQLAVEDALEGGFRADYEAKVSRIGRGTLGTYWPRDVERVLGLRPGQRFSIEIVAPNAALVRVQGAAKRRREKRDRETRR